jgi:hypothetical protein
MRYVTLSNVINIITGASKMTLTGAKEKRQICALASVWILVATAGALAQGRGHGRDNGKQGREYRYSDHDRERMRDWYHGHLGNLPPGLAKRDRLPPGLEKQIRVRGTLPPGLRARIRPCPPDFERLLPPPPPDCEPVFIGGNLVLMNRRTFVVLDIFHLEP